MHDSVKRDYRPEVSADLQRVMFVAWYGATQLAIVAAAAGYAVAIDSINHNYSESKLQRITATKGE